MPSYLLFFPLFIALASPPPSPTGPSLNTGCGRLAPPNTQAELLRGRLTVSLPHGATALPNSPRNLMGASDSADILTVFELSDHGQRLRVVASELLQKRGGIDEAHMSKALAHLIGMEPEALTPVPITRKPNGLAIFARKPRQPRSIDGSTTVLAAFVSGPDDLLIFVGIAIDGVPGTPDACTSYAVAIASSLGAGQRKLPADGGWRSLGSVAHLGSIEILLPPGWFLETKRGADYDVWQLSRPTTFGSRQMIGIYSGGHPDFKPNGTPAYRGTVLTRGAEWYGMPDTPCCRQETLVKVTDHDFLHVWIVGQAASEMAGIRKIVESIKTSAAQ